MIEKCKEKNIPLKIYVTDTRVPLGDLNGFLKQYPDSIEIVSVVEKTKKVIRAAVKGVNFYSDKHTENTDWEQSVLQSIEGFDYKVNGNN